MELGRSIDRFGSVLQPAINDDVNTQEGECPRSGVGLFAMRKFRKQSPTAAAAPKTCPRRRGIIVQTIKSFINLPMFVPLSISGGLCQRLFVATTIGSGPATDTATSPDIQIFSPNIKTLLSPSWARKLTHLNRASDRISTATVVRWLAGIPASPDFNYQPPQPTTTKGRHSIA